MYPRHTQTVTHLPQDDINVPSNQLRYLLPLCSLHAVVLVSIVPKVQGEAVGGGGPATHSGQGPGLHDLVVGGLGIIK